MLDYYGQAISTYPVEVSTFVDRVIPLVLMDVTISDADERFDVGEFTQEMPSAPREAWQVPYDEALFSEDGSAVLARWTQCERHCAQVVIEDMVPTVDSPGRLTAAAADERRVEAS